MRHSRRGGSSEELISLTAAASDYVEPDIQTLETYATGHPGQDLSVPFGADDIGGELVSIASEGLYSDPRDALREFCQNGVDAGAGTVTIRFTGLNVAVIDDGAGMDFRALLLARRFGRSSKSALSNVGFRGIGIYSGFQICDRLTLVSQRARSDERWTMTFDFAAMRRILRESSGDDRAVESALPRLIQANTAVSFDRISLDELPSRGSTVALLENIDPDAYTELSEIETLRSYLMHTLPVPFDDSFEHKARVERQLRRAVPGYATVQVRLMNDDTGVDELITRSFPPDLLAPRFLEASWPPEQPLPRAFIWGCMSDRKTLRDEAGIFFKKRGFTIGDGAELREKFLRRPAVYEWYAGEVYVIDDAVIPNAARNGFERNVAYRNLWSSLDAPMAVLLKEADDYSKRQRAMQVVDEVETECRHLLGVVDDETDLPRTMNVLERIQRLYARLESQKVPARDPSYNQLRKKKSFLVNLLGQERERLREFVTSGQLAAATRHAEPVESDPRPTDRGNVSSDPAREEGVTSSLAQVFIDAGRPVSPLLRRALAHVDAAIAEVLGETSSLHRELVDALQKQLTANPEG